MEYKGKLYGRLGDKMYFDTGKTSDDWDALEKRVAELEVENQTLRQPTVINNKKPIEKILSDAIKDSYDKIKDNLEPPL